MSEEIRALLIYEILGKPPEHIEKTLNEFIDKLGENKGINITQRKVHEAHVFEKKDEKGELEKTDLFTTFAEVEIEADDLNLIFMIVVNMLPANIEIIEPTLIRITNFDLSQTLSELTIKLHRYDEVAKALTMERYALIGKLKEMQKKIKELELKIEDKEEVKKKSKKDKSKK